MSEAKALEWRLRQCSEVPTRERLIDDALREARVAALEEAAVACEREGYIIPPQIIRELKTTPAEEPTK